MARDSDLSDPMAGRAARGFSIVAHFLSCLILSVPGLLLLLLHSWDAALAGLILTVAVCSLLLALPRRVRLRLFLPTDPEGRLIGALAMIVFWLYVLQLTAAVVVRVCPVRTITLPDGRVVGTIWKGAGFKENMRPLAGIWYMVDPDCYYTEYPAGYAVKTERLEGLPDEPRD